MLFLSFLLRIWSRRLSSKTAWGNISSVFEEIFYRLVNFLKIRSRVYSAAFLWELNSYDEYIYSESSRVILVESNGFQPTFYGETIASDSAKVYDTYYDTQSKMAAWFSRRMHAFLEHWYNFIYHLISLETYNEWTLTVRG